MSRNFVPVLEKLLQSLLNQTRREGSAQKTQRRFVVYYITQDCAFSMRLDKMPVPPTTKWPFDLHIFKP
ncbi:MAG TPA: hypothetical protein VGN90_03595, partial [Pyrinomonadaceae bacterium]|nr:hypothetical protein [Pyrinomonadaceae bacterium]